MEGIIRRSRGPEGGITVRCSSLALHLYPLLAFLVDAILLVASPVAYEMAPTFYLNLSL